MNEHDFDPAEFGLELPTYACALADAEATKALGAAVARGSEPGDIVGLIGNLGAGKTTFSQGFCHALDAGDATSPTYTLLNVYRGDTDVFHFDLYRLESVDDLEGVGYWDYVESEAGITLVEWLDQIPAAWAGPESGTIVSLEYATAGRTARVWTTDRVLEHLNAL